MDRPVAVGPKNGWLPSKRNRSINLQWVWMNAIAPKTITNMAFLFRFLRGHGFYELEAVLKGSAATDNATATVDSV